MSEELLPCPFCAGDASEYWPNSTTKHYIQCNKCGARTALYLASHGGSAKDDWNSRASNTLIEEQAARIRQLEEFAELSSMVTHGLKENCDRLEARLSEAVKVLEKFNAHYPMGINPFLDEAGRAAKAFIATLGENKN